MILIGLFMPRNEEKKEPEIRLTMTMWEKNAFGSDDDELMGWTMKKVSAYIYMKMTFMFYSYIVYWLTIYNATHIQMKQEISLYQLTELQAMSSEYWAHIIKINWFQMDEGVVLDVTCSMLFAPHSFDK